MFNPTRRNRNIGTVKQGYGKDNRLVIPYPSVVMKSFHERLTTYHKKYREINGNRFEFVVEQTRENSQHACTVDDIAEILRHIPPADYGRLNLIILRQPKRKEEILSPVWGRLIYAYEFENEFRPAVILESMDLKRNMKWTKKLNPEQRKELMRLKEDGHDITENKRNYIINCSLNSIRNTQLYRTLLHEIGHYKHFLELVGEIEDSPDDEAYEDYEKRKDAYHKLATSVKEKYAHKYADKYRKMLSECGVIPFERIVKS